MPAHRPGGTSGVRAAVVLLAPVSSAFLACALSACGASSSDESGDADRRRLSASHAGCWVEDESDPRTGMVAGSWFDADDVGWFVGAGLTRCDGEGWSRSTARSDRTTDGPFEDAWGFTGTDLWAVGERGAAHWDGLDWEVAEATGGAFLRGIWGGQDGVMWAVGETAAYGGGGVVFRGTRDGVWSAIAIPAGGALNDVWGSAPDDVWAVGDGTMLHFDGDSWTRRDPAPPGVGGYAVWGASATDVWVAAGDVWRWRDGAWTRAAWLPEGSYRSVWGRSSDEVWVVRSCRDEGEPSVVFWDGDTWTVEVTSPSPAGWFEIDRVVGSPGGRVFGLSRPSGWVTERVGGSWKVVWPGSTQAAEAIAGTGPDDIWFASGYFAFHKGVSSWRAYRLPVSDTLVAIWAAAADDVWAAGRDNTLVHWDGSGWTATVVEDVAFFRDVWGSGGNDVWAVGYGADYVGVAVHWDGSAWRHVPTGTAERFSNVGGTSPTDAWIAAFPTHGAGCQLLHWDGAAWTPAAVPPPHYCDLWYPGYSDLAAVAPDDVWLGGPAGVWRFDGTSWVEMSANQTWFIHATAHDNVWTSGDDGLFHWDGSSWNRADANSVSEFIVVWGTDPWEMWGSAGGYLMKRLGPADDCRWL